VSEVLPPSGTIGTRIVIIGHNFVNSPKLRVRFGDVECSPTFHEQGTLICLVPNIIKSGQKTPMQLQVRVSNDAVNYCDTQVRFTCLNVS